MDVMKKEIIILVLILICTISGSAQRNRFFLYTQDGYQSSVFSLNIPSDDEKAEYEENLKGNEIEPSIEQVSKEEISETGYHDENPQIPKVDVKTKKETALEETEEKELQE